MIPVSEQFLSIQGEGPTTGTRAVFLRTHACNLFCGGGKYAEGAKWTCDTIPVFTKIQRRYSPDELLAEWNDLGWLAALRAGAHLVLTGGEPLLPERQNELIPFLVLLTAALHHVVIEVETNGTVIPQPDFHRVIRQYNVSPKLSSSGMPRTIRLVPEVLHWHQQNRGSCFKFVVADENDVQEMIHTIIEPFQIARDRCWLMPAAATRNQLLDMQPRIASLALTHGFHFCTRLHILLYDQATGV
jgi:6-pyruvoyltetrahydropterin 2'-reductase